jgi:signal transduction histidine kinase
VEEAAYALERKYPDRKILLQVEPVEVFADRTMMEMAVTNLIDNALKYSREAVTVTLDGHCFCVADRGQGIPADEIEKVTRKFYRIDRNSWDNSMGLGLAIVTYILALHRTALSIDSEPGVGTTICFDLPLPEAINKNDG